LHGGRLPTLATDLVTQRVNVIVTIGGDISARAAKSATTTIPIVFVTANDAAKIGFVASLNRPGGNLTGVSFLVVLALTKQLELLSQLAPTAEMIGLLVNPNNPNKDNMREAHTAAATLRKALKANTEQTLDAAFATLAGNKVGAVLVTSDPGFLARRERIVALTLHRLPAIYTSSRRQVVL
jgi:putative tryptophan/tyrosine transport system substrate-binding protein